MSALSRGYLHSHCVRRMNPFALSIEQKEIS